MSTSVSNPSLTRFAPITKSLDAPQINASACPSSSAKAREDEMDKVAHSIVLRIAAGDSSAETELVKRYRRGLYFVLCRECGDRELAQDITQDTLAKVIMNARASRINRPGALSWYIRQTGIYQLIDYKRKQKRRRTSPSTDIVIEAPSDDPTAAENIDAQHLAKLVRQILNEMPVERDRELLRRFYLIGQEKAVIAAEFNITSAHFDRVKFRALKRLRQLLTENMAKSGTALADLI